MRTGISRSRSLLFFVSAFAVSFLTGIAPETIFMPIFMLRGITIFMTRHFAADTFELLVEFVIPGIASADRADIGKFFFLFIFFAFHASISIISNSGRGIDFYP